MVGAFQRRVAVVVEQTAPSVAALVAGFTANDVKDECVTGDLLVHLDLDDVAALDALPVGHDEATRLFRENEPLHGLVIY